MSFFYKQVQTNIYCAGNFTWLTPAHMDRNVLGRKRNNKLDIFYFISQKQIEIHNNMPKVVLNSCVFTLFL